MKRMIFLMLTLLIWGTASMNAQVRIGGTTDPHGSAVLDLNSTDSNNANTLGLALPRVALTATNTIPTGMSTPVATGLMVYNTATAGTGATAVVPGVYYYNGNWVLVSGTAPVITTQPKSFSWSRLRETNGDPNGPTTVTSIAALSVTATGPGTLSYKWYKKAVNKNAVDTLVAATPTYMPVVTAWGMNSYYCVISNAYGSVKSEVADVAIGCGAKTATGGWLKFMCHNLGADTSLNPFIFTSINDTTSKDIKGWLFQWGRIADGHQWRSSAAVVRVNGVSGTFTTAGQIRSDSTLVYGRFILNPNDQDWRNPSDANLWNSAGPDNNPCPSGWRIPTQSEWRSLVGDADTTRPYETATANTWVCDRICELKPDGATTTMALPMAGWRRPINGGPVDGVGTWSNYWSTTSQSGYRSCLLGAYAGTVRPGLNWPRDNGMSVRCVAN
jgi:uncharacterized protein (TIGR02145 family)